MPFWLVALVFFVLDFFILHISYSWPYIIQSLLGIFPRADLFLDVNSPLWFLTLTLFYYLLFPLIFLKKSPWLTAILIYTASYFIIQLKLPVTIDVLHLYQLHLLAFPLGIAFASLFFEPYSFNRFVPDKIQSSLYNLKKPVWIKTILDRSKEPNIFRRSLKIINRPTYYAILIALLIFIGFMAYNSGVDEILDKEQKISLITMSAIILFFILKRFEIKLFHLFGLYAYEIYLIHWPLMSRYDIFFRWLPGWIAVILYLGLFLIIALIINKTLNLIYRTK
jgi:peptidoglycan/LPS O-acetylase OafA/YrhL